MKLAAIAATATDATADLVGIIAFEEDLHPGDALVSGTILGPVLGPRLRQTFTDERFKAKIGQTTWAPLEGTRRVAVVGAGPRATFRPVDARHSAAVLMRMANKVGARSLAIGALRDTARSADAAQAMRQLEFHSRWVEGQVQGLLLGAYRFDKYLTADKRTPPTVENVSLLIPEWLPLDAATAAIDRGTRVGRAIAHARDLVNEPARTLTPVRFAALAAARAKEMGLGVTVWGPAECRERGMGLFLAVAQGSSEEPRFIHLSWVPAAARKRVVLVGKGVTFDSGGLSLKTTDGMLGMKADMAGAAAVFSAIAVAAEEKLPVEVHALSACTENMPSGTAYKLGDVLRSMSGKTVEITNTDAEGRLTLADAITYGLTLQPDVVLDFATLTGACIVALGPHTAGAMTNDDDHLAHWLAAARDAGEDIWPLPLPPRLVEQLKSDIADLRNTGERAGGALTAGLFLKEFVGSTPWIHVDIAGPAVADKEWGCCGKGGTGFGVASIVEYLRTVATN